MPIGFNAVQWAIKLIPSFSQTETHVGRLNRRPLFQEGHQLSGILLYFFPLNRLARCFDLAHLFFRYSVTWSEVAGCTVQRCGIDAFEKGEGGKVGECFYIGTALDQISDNKVRYSVDQEKT